MKEFIKKHGVVFYISEGGAVLGAIVDEVNEKTGGLYVHVPMYMKETEVFHTADEAMAFRDKQKGVRHEQAVQ